MDKFKILPSLPVTVGSERNEIMLFFNRVDAGKKLADRLLDYSKNTVIVYAIPRGGVIVGNEIAKRLNSPLSLIITRKIGHPAQPEYAISAIAEDGDEIINPNHFDISSTKWYASEAKKQQAEATRRRQLYLGNKQQISAHNKTSILVDDGIATGLTIKLAIKELKHQHPKKIIIAVPVASNQIIKELTEEVDEIIVLYIQDHDFDSVASYYKHFPEVSDNEVISIMNTF